MRRTLIFLILLSGHALAAPVTEGDVVARVLQHTDVRALLAARRDLADATVIEAGRWDNPEIEYSDESLGLPGGDANERFLWIRQRLNVAGVKGLQRDAAAQRRIADHAHVAVTERELVADVRRLFYTALAAEAEQQLLREWQSRLDELTSAVGRRVAAGDAARYDLLRLRQELALGDGHRLQAEAEAMSARERLFGLTGIEQGPLAGTTLPPPADAARLAERLESHPLLAALDALAESETLAATAARREAWPEVTVGVGRQEVSEPGADADGSMVSVGVEVPLFDRGTGEALAAQSRARGYVSERALATTRLNAAARAALRRLETNRASAAALQAAAAEGDSLAEIAEAAYAAGELSVMELIDAYRSDLAAREEAVRRSFAAREAYIEFQFLTGAD